MKILFVVMGYVQKERIGISGGDVHWLKFAKWLVSQGHDVSVFATDACEEFIRKYDSEIKLVSAGNLGSMTPTGGLLRTWRALTSLRRINGHYDHVYSVSTLCYDILPGFLMKLFRKTKWTVVCHWIAPLFGRNTRFLSALLFYMGDRLGLLLMSYANVILCMSEPTRKKTLKLPFLSKHRIHGMKYGVEMGMAADRTIAQGEFIAANIKRIAKTKGSFDLPVIWKKVVNRFPSAKLVMCGEGSDEEVATLNRLIKENGMENNIDFRGAVFDDTKKFEILHEAHCFVLPTYEENWAICLGEGLASGCETLCYDLPDIHPVWGESIHWVPIGNTDEFAERICSIFEGKLTKKDVPKSPSLVSWEDISAEHFKKMTEG